jgi:desulfoferrodoxin (superoxide reductase-like protein)
MCWVGVGAKEGEHPENKKKHVHWARVSLRVEVCQMSKVASERPPSVSPVQEDWWPDSRCVSGHSPVR